MDNDWQDELLTAGAIVGSVWLAKKIFEDKYYKCPRCNYPVDQKMTFCPNCGQPLQWGGKK